MSTDKQPRRFKLLKDLPDAKKDDVYEQIKTGDYFLTPHRHGSPKSSDFYSAETVENNPEWFEEVKEQSLPDEKIKVESFFAASSPYNDHCYILRVNKMLPEKSFQEIRKKIENCLNSKEEKSTTDEDYNEVILKVFDKGIGKEYYLPDGTQLCEHASYVRLFNQMQEFWEDQLNKKAVPDNPPSTSTKEWEIVSFMAKGYMNGIILSKNPNGTFGDWDTEESSLLPSSVHSIHSVGL